MNYLRGPDRAEIQLLPPCLDDYVGADAPARFIDAFVEGVDLGVLGFTRAQAPVTGRPPYHPADLLKLYLYGYLNRIRSSRRLEAEAARNLELIWLLRGLRPDFKTIADFRKDNRVAFKPLLKSFNLLCRKLELFGAELLAIDGSKFKAVNNSRRHYTQEQLAQLIETIESRIEDYLSQLDATDAEAWAVGSSVRDPQLKEKLAVLQERKGQYDQLLKELEDRQQNECSLSDPDARTMKGPQAYLIGYNVQVAVDAKNHLIAAEEVTQASNDTAQLAPMARAAKEQLAKADIKVVADKGYHSADQLEACEQAGIEVFVPDPGKRIPRGKDGTTLFAKEAFGYDPTLDVYHCPGQQTLARATRDRNHGKERDIYYNYMACRQCSLRPQCTAASYRKIVRRLNEAAMERNTARVRMHPELVARRKEIVEHVFGTLRGWGCDHFLTRGLEKVRAEFSLSAFAYNFRRVLNLISFEDFTRAIWESRATV